MSGSEGTEVVHDGHHDESFYAILFLFVSLLVGAMSRHLLAKVPVPYTALLLVWGVVFGLLEAYEGSLGEPFHQAVKMWLQMTPHLLLYTFLPILLFASAFSMDWHIFKVCLSQCLTLAGPGVVLSTGITAAFAKFCLPYAWTWPESLLFGCILSATDPVAVVALLKEVGASKKLAVVIEGESLLNDGTAFVLFLVFQEMVQGVQLGPGEIVTKFVRLALGGPLVGILFAMVASWWLSWIFNDACLEISITLTLAYLCFFTAEGLLGVSSVLAIVACGVYMSAIGKTRITPSVEHPMEIFWEMLEYLGNTVIFVYSGLKVGVHLGTRQGDYQVQGADWGWCLLLYVALQIIRGITVAILYPLLRRMGYGLDWRTALVMVWGGLRGAMGLALALIISLDNLIDAKFRTLLEFFVSMVAVMTIVVNGTTMPLLISKLGILKVSKAKRQFLQHSLEEMNNVMEKRCTHLKQDKLMGNPDWKQVKQLTYIKTEYLDPDKKHVSGFMSQFSGFNKKGTSVTKTASGKKSTHNAVTKVESFSQHEHLDDARIRFLSIVKTSYGEGFEKGYIASHLLNALKESADKCLDDSGIPIHDWVTLERSIDLPAWLTFLNNRLSFLQNIADNKKTSGNGSSTLCHKSKIGALFYNLAHWPQDLLYGKLKDCAVLAMSFVFAHGVARHSLQKLMITSEDDFDEKAKAAYITVIKESSAECKLAHAYIEGLKLAYPEVMRMIKTQLTAHTVLMHKKRFVKGIMASGLVDEKEGYEMADMVNIKVKDMLFKPLRPNVSKPEELFYHNSIFSVMKREDFDQYVLPHVNHVVFNAKAKIPLAAEAKSVFAHAPTLARRATRTPRTAFSEVEEGEDLLQSSDNFRLSMSHEDQTKVFCITRGSALRHPGGSEHRVQAGPGDMVGLLQFMTKIPDIAQPVSETPLEGFCIPVKTVENIFEMFSSNSRCLPPLVAGWSTKVEEAAWKREANRILQSSEGDKSTFDTLRPEGMMDIFQDATLVTLQEKDELCFRNKQIAVLLTGKVIALEIEKELTAPWPLDVPSIGHSIHAMTECKLLTIRDYTKTGIRKNRTTWASEPSDICEAVGLDTFKTPAKKAFQKAVKRVCSLNRAKDGFGKPSDGAKAVVPLKHAVNAFEELAIEHTIEGMIPSDAADEAHRGPWWENNPEITEAMDQVIDISQDAAPPNTLQLTAVTSRSSLKGNQDAES